MSRESNNPLRRAAALLAAAALAAASGLASISVAQAQEAEEAFADLDSATYSSDDLVSPQDANATTDDKSVTVPTGWWIYNNITEAQVNSFLSANGARLTDLEIYSVTAGVPRFTVTMVKNAGVYAVPGWAWYYGQTFAQVGSLLSANSARLLRLAPYDSGGGVQKFAVIMVANTGTTARGWTYLSGATTTDIANNINNSNQRMIDIDTYGTSANRFSAVFVTNSGTDNKAWQWWVNQTAAQVASRISAFGGRLVHFSREANGNYDIILHQNTDGFYWHWNYGFTSAATMLNYANQRGERITDVSTYVASGSRRYAAVFLDNANTTTRRIRSIFAPTFLDGNNNPTRGTFEAYLKRAGSTELVNLNAGQPTEVASAIKALHLAHAYKQVQNGVDGRGNGFIYYDYPNSPFNPNTSNACPITGDETAGNTRTNYTLGTGLDQMMAISDNRTTRGVLLRYGRPAIQGTATAIGMTNTTLRSNGNHNNLGCFYYNVETGNWTELGNATTAGDLAKLYESVIQSTFLTGTARTQFLASANPGTGASTAIRAIISNEAAKVGKSAIATQFGNAWKSNSKGGSYGGQLATGQQVRVLSGAGLVQIPIKGRAGVITYRNYVWGNLYSNTPVGTGFPAESTYQSVLANAGAELYREEIRSALLTW